MKYLIYLTAVFLILFITFMIIHIIEHYYCVFIKKQVPLVASSKRLRRLVAKEIQSHYPNAKIIIEPGSGFGGMMRYIARKTDKKIVGIENIHWYAFISSILDKCYFNKTHTICCDAFEYFKNTKDHIDIVIAYMGPVATHKILTYRDKISVLVSLDFPIDNMSPTRIIDAGPGATVIGKTKYPHKLYIYEFDKK